MKEGKLDKLIFSHYSKSALWPILIIEILLLAIYFLINYYTNYKAEASLKQEVQTVIPHLVKQQSQQINNAFNQIYKETAYFAQANTSLLQNLNRYNVQGEQPKFALAPNGTYYQTNLDSGSSLFYTKGATLSAAQKEKALKSAALNPLYVHIVKDVPNVAAAYLNTPDDMNRLYPFIPKVYEQYPVDLNMEDYNFYYLADEKHNPAKVPVWTGVYLDPAGNGWMLSCVAPVYVDNKLEGVVGLDVTTTNIVNRVLKTDLPWGATAFLADDKGMILAMSPRAEEIFGLKELKSHVYSSAIKKEQQKPEDFNLFKSKDPNISQTFKNIYASKNDLYTVTLDNKPVFIMQEKIQQTGWRLFILAEQDVVYASAKDNAYIASLIGYAVVVIMIVFYLFFFVMLRRKAAIMSDTIAEPIINLADATSKIGREEAPELVHCGIAEIDSLTDTFNTMSNELEIRNKELIEHQVRIKVREKEAELAYAQGMYEAASGYLHNVGNSITALNSNLMDLNEVIKSTEQYPAVFNKLRTDFQPDFLDKFEEVLINKTIPKLTNSVDRISQIRENIQQTISHQQQSFKDSRDIAIPMKFNLSELTTQLIEEFTIKYPKVVFSSKISPELYVSIHRIQSLNGLTNVLKNAVEATNYTGEINVELKNEQDKNILTVTDNGMGIAPENLQNMLTAGFTTKANGTGLGLHSFAVFLSAGNNSLRINSKGVDLGATVIVEVENVR